MNLLRVDGLGFSYTPGAPVLTDLTFDIEAGASVLVLGDNGSGKSTLGRLVGGLTAPSVGTISIAGTPLARTRRHDRPSQTIYLSQVSYLQFFRATIDEEIDLAARQSGHARPAADEIAVFSLPAGDANPRDLSYPEMWRLQLLLLGVIFNPRVLFVDEVVAPGARQQQTALAYLLGVRRTRGLVTLLAYQRRIDIEFDHVFEMVSGRLVPADRASRPAEHEH